MHIDEIIQRLHGVKKSRGGWQALCPAHADSNPSLSISEKGGKVLLHCHAGCSYQEVMTALDLFPGVSPATANARRAGSPSKASFAAKRSRSKVAERTQEAVYDYTDDTGELLFQVVRSREVFADGTTGKTFVARRPPRADEMPGADGWIYNIDGVQLVLYRLPGAIAANTVYVVEGERDVETLHDLGVTATCNPFGAGKWRDGFAECLRCKVVRIIPDNDETGRQHAHDVARSVSGIASDLRIVNLPGALEKGDVTDFIAGGGTIEQLEEIAASSPAWSAVEAEDNPVTERTGFNFCTVTELMAEEPEETSFVWEDTLPSSGFSIISSKPKVGKSTVVRNLCRAGAIGEPFLGRETVCGTVLYLCLEEKRAEVQDHFRRMDVGGDRILIHTGVTPKNPFDELSMALERYSPSLVIIDPLSRILRVTDFNDYGGMARGLEPFVDLARTSGSHLMAAHHDVKQDRSGGEAILGSTAIFGSVDCHLSIRMRNGSRILSSTQRYGETFPETVLRLDRDTGIVTSLGDLPTLTINEAKDAVLSAIGHDEILNQAEIKARVSGFVNGAISKALGALISEGAVVRLGQGLRNDPFLYSKNWSAER